MMPHAMTESSAPSEAREASDPQAFAQALESLQSRVERALEATLERAGDVPTALRKAMAYATLEGGKRVRAVLVYGAGRAVGADDAALDAPACAVELIHAYSLVHDDMPCMDDDALRRGKPTCHIAFGEATALLAGDALQSLAFQSLATVRAVTPERRVAMVHTLSEASGLRGMAGGQAIDLASVGQPLSLGELETMHRLKTGALIRASTRLGGLAACDPSDPVLDALDEYAACIGLAFQIQDDILDVEGSTETIGKTQGADQALGKPTYPALLGLDASRRRAIQLYEQSVAALEPFGATATLLRELAQYVVRRNR